MYELKIKRIWRAQLPHWEVESGIYFITIRCAGSLPKPVLNRIEEIQKSIAAIDPACEEFNLLQRQYFATLDKYLDQGEGFAPFKNDNCCEFILESFDGLKGLGWEVRHYAIMPNHIHLVIWADNAADMATTWSEWKGRLAHRCNKHLNRKGGFWQSDWFDRVCRNEAETQRVVGYVQNNPKKAHLPTNYRWVK